VQNFDVKLPVIKTLLTNQLDSIRASVLRDRMRLGGLPPKGIHPKSGKEISLKKREISALIADTFCHTDELHVAKLLAV
jgi:hypothetical protein